VVTELELRVRILEQSLLTRATLARRKLTSPLTITLQEIINRTGPSEPVGAGDERGLVHDYIRTKIAAGELPTQSECSRVTGLTCLQIHPRWPVDFDARSQRMREMREADRKRKMQRASGPRGYD
jgi:hypothetical protein